MKRRGSTLFLRAATIAIGALVLLLCLFALPPAWQHGITREYSDTKVIYALRGILLAMYIAAIPFFYALAQGWRLLNLIDKGKAFSMQSVAALKRISVAAIIIAAVFLLCEPSFYIWAENDDAPGLVIFGLLPVGAALTIAVFAGVLQRLFRDAIKIKSENDLTV